MNSLTNHDSQSGHSDVDMIYPRSMAIKIINGRSCIGNASTWPACVSSFFFVSGRMFQQLPLASNIVRGEFHVAELHDVDDIHIINKSNHCNSLVIMLVLFISQSIHVFQLVVLCLHRDAWWVIQPINSSLFVTPWAHGRTNSRWQCASQVAWIQKLVSKTHRRTCFLTYPSAWTIHAIHANYANYVAPGHHFENVWAIFMVSHKIRHLCLRKNVIFCHPSLKSHISPPITFRPSAWSYEERACRPLWAYGLEAAGRLR